MKLSRIIPLASITVLIVLGCAVYLNSFLKGNILASTGKTFHIYRSMKATSDLAMAYENKGMHDEAIGIYNGMLKEDPGHPGVYVNLAAIQIKKRNMEDAIALCKKAIALEPNNATAHNNIAVAYYVQGKYDLAIQHCDLAIKYGYKVKDELIALLRPYRQ